MTQDELNDALENVERSLLQRLKELMAAVEAIEAKAKMDSFISVRTYGPTWITIELDRGLDYPELMYVSLN